MSTSNPSKKMTALTAVALTTDEDDTAGSSYTSSESDGDDSEQSGISNTSAGSNNLPLVGQETSDMEQQPQVQVQVQEAGCCSKLSFFCRKRACLLFFCLLAMGASVLLFTVDILYGSWEVLEDHSETNGTVEKSYQPGNNATFFVLLLSILLFQAALSTILVLFAYQYKRDAQEYQDQLTGTTTTSTSTTTSDRDDSESDHWDNEVAELYSDLPQLQRQMHRQERSQTRGRVKIGRLGFFYRKQKASFSSIFSVFAASVLTLVLSKVHSHVWVTNFLFVVGMLLFSASYASTVWLVYVHYRASVQEYESIRTLKRKLSHNPLPSSSSLASNSSSDYYYRYSRGESTPPWMSPLSYFWKKREPLVSHTIALLLFSIIFLTLVFLLGGWINKTSASSSSSSSSAVLGDHPSNCATMVLFVFGAILFAVSLPVVLLVLPCLYFWDSREYHQSVAGTDTRQQGNATAGSGNNRARRSIKSSSTHIAKEDHHDADDDDDDDSMFVNMELGPLTTSAKNGQDRNIV